MSEIMETIYKLVGISAIIIHIIIELYKQRRRPTEPEDDHNHDSAPQNVEATKGESSESQKSTCTKPDKASVQSSTECRGL
jgi:hypothetical protein